MSIQHNAIADADRHEAKGASSASINQILRSNGDGTTSFVAASSVPSYVTTVVLSNSDTTTQSPSVVDTAQGVTFGTATSNSDLALSTPGVVTFTTPTFYIVTIDLNFGRTAAAGVAIMLARVLVNGIAIAPTYVIELADEQNLVSKSIILQRSFNASDTLSVQFMRDSGGINNGSLTPVTPTIGASWAVAPSARIQIQKVLGAS